LKTTATEIGKVTGVHRTTLSIDPRVLASPPSGSAGREDSNAA
jgi:hypothetical protein